MVWLKFSDGISPADLVVYEGINKIRDGSIVKIK